MSTQNIDFNDSGAIKRDYSNVDRRDEIIDAVENDDDVDEDALPGERASQQELTEARRTIAEEEQPGEDGELPDLRATVTETFRGHEFEFYEMGDRLIEAAQFNDVEEGDIEAGTQAAEYVYRSLGETSVEADESYWRQYDFQGDEDTEGVMDLFSRLMEKWGDDVDPEEARQSQQFLNE